MRGDDGEHVGEGGPWGSKPLVELAKEPAADPTGQLLRLHAPRYEEEHSRYVFQGTVVPVQIFAAGERPKGVPDTIFVRTVHFQ